MKRLSVVLVLLVVAIGVFGEPVPVPFAGSLYMLSWHFVSNDEGLVRSNTEVEFQYPGSVQITENGTCAINYTNGLYEEFNWARHPEMENVIVITPQQGPDAYLSFAPIPENEATAATWTMTLIGAYPTGSQARTYLVTQPQ